MATLNINEVTVDTAIANEIVTAAGNGAQFLFYTGSPPADAPSTGLRSWE